VKAQLFLHQAAPPFAPIRQLLTATNIDRIHPLDQAGQLQFQVAQTEGQDSPSPISLKEGMAVVDRSSEGVEPWLWFISRIGFDIASGMVDVECSEWRQLLYERTVPLSTVASSRAAGRVAVQLLTAANSRNPTHIIPHFSWMSGLRHTLSSPLGGLTVGAAFDQIAKETDTEWWVHYHVTWNSVAPTLHWGFRRGLDRSYSLHLQEGYHLSQGVYSRDGRGQARLVQVIGGGGSSAAPSGALSLGAAVAQDRPSTGGRLEPVPESQRRKMLVASGPAVSSESLQVSPNVQAESSLITSSLRQVTLPVSALQQVEASVGGNIAWNAFGLGDVVLIRLSSAQLRQGADIPARIVALQPDEAEGEMALALEVQL